MAVKRIKKIEYKRRDSLRGNKNYSLTIHPSEDQDIEQLLSYLKSAWVYIDQAHTQEDADELFLLSSDKKAIISSRLLNFDDATYFSRYLITQYADKDLLAVVRQYFYPGMDL